MNEREMIARTKQFALRIMKLESAFWLELIIEGNLLAAAQIQPLLTEASELIAMMASSKKTASSALAKSQIANRKSQMS